MRLFLILVLLLKLMVGNANGSGLRVGISVLGKVTGCQVSCTEGAFDVFSDGSVVFTLTAGNSITIETGENGLCFVAGLQSVTGARKVTLDPKSAGSVFLINGVNAGSAGWPYSGGLELLFKSGKLALVNTIELEEYVSCVLEAEIGIKANPEMMKVQAMLVRTYALGHLDRHEKDGFMLCDKVHCQVYEGRSHYNVNVHRAVHATKGKVIVDNQNQLILAAYHSNCGGVTANSTDVWSENRTYLQCVNDSFCLSSPNAAWTKVVPLAEWRSYLKSKGVDDADSLYFTTSSANRTERSCCLLVNDKDLPMKSVRKDLNLKSAFFSVEVKEDAVVLRGRGYGHGVGLCQEGASKMASHGYIAEEIIAYYFKGVRIISSIK